MARRISITDIAQRAQVSHTTVSRALRGHPRISSAMRERIVALAHEMGYVPNVIAQSLQQQHTRTIGLVISDIADPFWGAVVHGVDERCRTNGQVMLLHAAAHDARLQLEALLRLAERRVDGIIIADAQLDPNDIQRVEALGIPVVCLNAQRPLDSATVRSVPIDNYAGGAAAATHLLQLGHQRFAYFGSAVRPGSNLQRATGFADTLRTGGIITNRIARIEAPVGRDDITAGFQMATEFRDPGVTAVFCYNDTIALGALAAFRARGVHVPQHISVVGFDDVPMAQYSWPPLTTVAQPKALLGQTAVDTLTQLIDGNTVADAVIAPVLITRESSAASKGHRT